MHTGAALPHTTAKGNTMATATTSNSRTNSNIEFTGKGYATEANALRHIAKHTPKNPDGTPEFGYRFLVAVQGGKFFAVVLLTDNTRWRLGYFIHNNIYVCG